MNQIAHISYEDRAKARAKEIRLRLMGPQKRVNLSVVSLMGEYTPPVQQPPAPEPRHHVDAWAVHLKSLNDIRPSLRFVKMQCFIHGVTYAEVRSGRRPRYLSLAREKIVIATHEAFPDLSTTQLGDLVNKDHTSVLKYLGRLKCKSAAGKQWRDAEKARAQ